MKVYKGISSVEILDFMHDNMKSLDVGQTTIASIPNARFFSSFPIEELIRDNYKYVSMAVTRGILPHEDMPGLYQESNHHMIALFGGEMTANGEKFTSGDVLLLKRDTVFRTDEDTLWGFVPLGYAVHLAN